MGTEANRTTDLRDNGFPRSTGAQITQRSGHYGNAGNCVGQLGSLRAGEPPVREFENLTGGRLPLIRKEALSAEWAIMVNNR